jgi:hypothetical protein
LDPEDTHPGNESLSRILKTAKGLSSNETVEIIRKELALFSMLVEAETKQLLETEEMIASASRANL